MGWAKKRGAASHPGMVVATLHVGTRLYEQRMNRCGKTNCRVCGPRESESDRRPGHGPYWYLCVTRGSKWVRVYIGRELDTQRFVGKDGQVDWGQIRALRKEREERRCRHKAETDGSNLNTN